MPDRVPKLGCGPGEGSSHRDTLAGVHLPSGAGDQVRSVLSLPLFTGEDALGSLNLYAQTAHSFALASRAAGVVFAAQVAMALSAAQQQERAAHQQEQAQLVDDLVGVLGHELRSRMTAISASVGLLLRRRAQLDGRGQEALELLAGELGRQQRLLLDLLDLARAERGPLSARTPLLPVVREVLHDQPRSPWTPRTLPRASPWPPATTSSAGSW